MNTKLPESVRGALRLFAFYLANGTIDPNVIEVDGSDYLMIFEEPSILEQVFAIWGNIIEFDEKGEVINAGAAQKRVAQYIRRLIDPNFVVEPPFENWELELHLY